MISLNDSPTQVWIIRVCFLQLHIVIKQAGHCLNPASSHPQVNRHFLVQKPRRKPQQKSLYYYITPPTVPQRPPAVPPMTISLLTASWSWIIKEFPEPIIMRNRPAPLFGRTIVTLNRSTQTVGLVVVDYWGLIWTVVPARTYVTLWEMYTYDRLGDVFIGPRWIISSCDELVENLTQYMDRYCNHK